MNMLMLNVCYMLILALKYSSQNPADIPFVKVGNENISVPGTHVPLVNITKVNFASKDTYHILTYYLFT